MKYIKDSVQWWDYMMTVIGIWLHRSGKTFLPNSRKVLHDRNVRNWTYFWGI